MKLLRKNVYEQKAVTQKFEGLSRGIKNCSTKTNRSLEGLVYAFLN